MFSDSNTYSKYYKKLNCVIILFACNLNILILLSDRMGTYNIQGVLSLRKQKYLQLHKSLVFDSSAIKWNFNYFTRKRQQFFCDHKEYKSNYNTQTLWFSVWQKEKYKEEEAKDLLPFLILYFSCFYHLVPAWYESWIRWTT